MLKELRQIGRTLIPASLYDLSRKGYYSFFRFLFKGSRYACPLCGKSFRRFLPSGLDIAVLEKFNIVGAGSRANALCPNCHSNERERLVYLYLQHTGLLNNTEMTILHIAPEPNLQKVLQSSEHIRRYVPGDLHEERVAVRLDIRNMPIQEGMVELAICNHVLEHVPDDLSAMEEIFRAIAPGGTAILQVPYSTEIEASYEDPAVTEPEERETVFGQRDHVRIYALNSYLDRLSGVGFQTKLFQFPDQVIQQYALNPDEQLIIVEKINEN